MDVFRDPDGVCSVLIGFQCDMAHMLTHHQICNISDANMCMYTNICSKATFDTYTYVETIKAGTAAFIKAWKKAKCIHALIDTPYPMFTRHASQQIIARAWKAHVFRKAILRLPCVIVKHKVLQELYYLPHVGVGYYSSLDSWLSYLKI